MFYRGQSAIPVKMDYTIYKNKIIYHDRTFFNIADTLGCGQLFRYKDDNGRFTVCSKKLTAILYYIGNSVVIETDDTGYFERFFDLNRNYGIIYNKVSSDAAVKQAADAGKGIRILNGDLAEIIFSFIISANNNIPRIKKIIANICSGLGAGFPDTYQLYSADERFYRECGCGYRARYIVETAKTLANTDILSRLPGLSTEKAGLELSRLSGVGPKVRDCILLFGLHRTDIFPVDTWIEKVYREDLRGDLHSYKDISGQLVARFGEYSGYAQQYLFHYKRNLERITNN